MTGAKDKMMGAGKEVAGGILGKEHLKKEGEAQQVPPSPPLPQIVTSSNASRS